MIFKRVVGLLLLTMFPVMLLIDMSTNPEHKGSRVKTVFQNWRAAFWRKDGR